MATKYFVLTNDGRRFGPGELDVLEQWAKEKRLDEQTALEAEDGTRMPAWQVIDFDVRVRCENRHPAESVTRDSFR